jgi:hypothetical protein
MQVQAPAMIGPDEVEGMMLAEPVGAVAGDPVRGVRTATHSSHSGKPDDHGAG